MSDEVLSVVGKYDGIKEKSSGWFEVEVSVTGKQYPLRLATKRSSLLDNVRATQGEIATFYYKESESQNNNPNTGRPYTNRFLEGVEAGAAAGTTASGNGGGGGGKENVDWDAKERRDFRSRAWAVTVSAFQHTIKEDEDPTSVFLRLRPFQQALYDDVVRELGEVPLPSQAEAQPEQQQLEQNQYPDDDIPF